MVNETKANTKVQSQSSRKTWIMVKAIRLEANVTVESLASSEDEQGSQIGPPCPGQRNDFVLDRLGAELFEMR